MRKRFRLVARACLDASVSLMLLVIIPWYFASVQTELSKILLTDPYLARNILFWGGILVAMTFVTSITRPRIRVHSGMTLMTNLLLVGYFLELGAPILVRYEGILVSIDPSRCLSIILPLTILWLMLHVVDFFSVLIRPGRSGG